MTDTICGIFIDQFKEKPTTRELGRLVAHLSIAEQADFLMEFAGALEDTTASSIERTHGYAGRNARQRGTCVLFWRGELFILRPGRLLSTWMPKRKG